MNKNSLGVMAIAGLLAAAPAALAETAPGPAMHNPAQGAAARNARVNEVQPGQLLVSKLDGANLYGEQNRQIGSVQNIVLDLNGRVAGVAVKLDSDVRKAPNNGNAANGDNDLVRIGLNEIKATTVNGEPRFMVEMTAQQLAAAPPYPINGANRTATNQAAAKQRNVQNTAAAGQNGQMLAKNLNGADVYDTQNKKAGSIRDIVLNPAQGRVAEVVIGVNGRNIAVPMQNLRIALNNNGSNNLDDATVKRVTIDRTEAQLQSAPVFQLNPGSSNG